MIIIKHYSHITNWDSERYPNFHPSEKNLHCPCCGEFCFDTESFDAVQYVRTYIGKPAFINSCHRCLLHNARVGGAPLSRHKLVAFDISIIKQDKKRVLEGCIKAGFNSFGFYGTFLHVDIRKFPARWVTKEGRKTWNGLIP